MPKQGGKFDKVWPGIAAGQEGIVSRAQLLAAGVTEGQARREIVAGTLDQRPHVIEVAIPHHRQTVKGTGLRFYRMRGLADLVHPAATPPRLRLEPALLAATHSADNAEPVLDLVLRCTQRRPTTTARLERSLKACLVVDEIGSS